MKNLFLSALLLVCTIGMAQTMPKSKSSYKPISYGIKAGLNLSRLTDFGNSTGTTSTRNSINVGAYMKYKFSDVFAFQPELLYTTQGMILNQVNSNANYKLTYKLDYIAIPLMIKFYPAKFYNLEIGPQVAFNIKKDVEVKGDGQTVTLDLDDLFQMNGADAKTNIVDVAMNIGTSYEFSNGINFNFRYSYGLTKVFTGSDVVDSNGKPEKVKNSVLSFGLGYTFQ